MFFARVCVKHPLQHLLMYFSSWFLSDRFTRKGEIKWPTVRPDASGTVISERWPARKNSSRGSGTMGSWKRFNDMVLTEYQQM